MIDDLLLRIREDVSALLNADVVSLGEATPPAGTGVYALYEMDELTYVGEAKGSKGLRDRLLSKHVSGSDSHAIQRAFLERFPNRQLRRDHIRRDVFAQWLEISDLNRISAVERVLICLYSPKWNKT